MWRRALVAVVVAGTLTVPAAAASADHGQLGVGLRPLASELEDPTPRDARYLVAHLAPGATIERTVEVYNGEAAGTEIRVFGADATVEDGAFRPAEDSGDGIGDWITVEPPRVRLDHGERRNVTVRLTVPDDAAAGERYGLVIAEPTATAPSSDGGVATVTRIGMRVYLSVRPGAAPASDFRVDRLTARRTDAGVPVVEVAVENTGGRAIEVGGLVHFSDGPGGTSAGPFELDAPVTVVAGDAAVAPVTLPADLPSGPWSIRVDVTAGTVERSVEATLRFPDAPGGVADPVAATPVYRDRATLLPLAGGLVVAALAAVGLVWTATRRRREGASRWYPR
jgi:hypothetical protein